MSDSANVQESVTIKKKILIPILKNGFFFFRKIYEQFQKELNYIYLKKLIIRINS